VRLQVGQGRRRLLEDPPDGAVDAASALVLEGVDRAVGRDAPVGDVGAGGAVEPPGVDRQPLDQDGAGPGRGRPLVEEAVAQGLELGGVLAREDDVLGAEAVLQAIQLDSRAVL
jgi:hypothetical protein